MEEQGYMVETKEAADALVLVEENAGSYKNDEAISEAIQNAISLIRIAKV